MHRGTSACVSASAVGAVGARRGLLRWVLSEPQRAVDVVAPGSVKLVLAVVVVVVAGGGGVVARGGCRVAGLVRGHLVHRHQLVGGGYRTGGGLGEWGEQVEREGRQALGADDADLGELYSRIEGKAGERNVSFTLLVYL